jgi:hypothetical protein
MKPGFDALCAVVYFPATFSAIILNCYAFTFYSGLPWEIKFGLGFSVVLMVVSKLALEMEDLR